MTEITKDNSETTPVQPAQRAPVKAQRGVYVVTGMEERRVSVFSEATPTAEAKRLAQEQIAKEKEREGQLLQQRMALLLQQQENPTVEKCEGI